MFLSLLRMSGRSKWRRSSTFGVVRMIITLSALAGQRISLDLREQFGESVEIECFQFVTPPLEFRLVRNSVPLQEWQHGNPVTYDLQHSPETKDWSRDGHRFINDCEHRNDVMTCGVLSKNLAIETTGLAFPITLLVWPRESTCRGKRPAVAPLAVIQS